MKNKKINNQSIKGFRHQNIQIDGLNIHYLDNDIKTSKVTYLFIAGWPQTSYAWRKVLLNFKKESRVIAVDLPGIGGSDPVNSFSTAKVAEHLHHFVQKLGLKEIHLITHDIGSWVGYAYSVKYEKDLSSLVLMEAGIPGISDLRQVAFTPEHNHKTWQFAFNQLNDLPELLVKGKEREYFEWLFKNKSYIKDAISKKDLEIYVDAYKNHKTMKYGFDYYRAISKSSKENLKFSKSKIKLPILVIAGEYGVGSSLELTVKKVAENVRGVVFERTGHYIPEERPIKLNYVLNSFYDSITNLHKGEHHDNLAY